MKILLTSIGTRGDMEPFLALAELLNERGHDVICLLQSYVERRLLFLDESQEMSIDKNFSETSLTVSF